MIIDIANVFFKDEIILTNLAFFFTDLAKFARTQPSEFRWAYTVKFLKTPRKSGITVKTTF